MRICESENGKLQLRGWTKWKKVWRLLLSKPAALFSMDLRSLVRPENICEGPRSQGRVMPGVLFLDDPVLEARICGKRAWTEYANYLSRRDCHHRNRRPSIRTSVKVPCSVRRCKLLYIPYRTLCDALYMVLQGMSNNLQRRTDHGTFADKLIEGRRIR